MSLTSFDTLFGRASRTRRHHGASLFSQGVQLRRLRKRCPSLHLCDKIIPVRAAVLHEHAQRLGLQAG